MIREYEFSCPECKGWIVLDLSTGEVLRHGKKGEKPEKVKPKALEDAFDRFEKKQQNTDTTFDGAVKSVEKQKRRLEDAFEDAKRKAAENPDEKPHRPFDDLFD